MAAADAVLEELRRLIKDRAVIVPYEKPELDDAIAKYFVQLDAYLSSGGDIPTAWVRKPRALNPTRYCWPHALHHEGTCPRCSDDPIPWGFPK